MTANLPITRTLRKWGKHRNGFGNRLAEGITIGCSTYQQRFQQTNKYRLFVFTFGSSFSIG